MGFLYGPVIAALAVGGYLYNKKRQRRAVIKPKKLTQDEILYGIHENLRDIHPNRNWSTGGEYLAKYILDKPSFVNQKMIGLANKIEHAPHLNNVKKEIFELAAEVKKHVGSSAVYLHTKKPHVKPKFIQLRGYHGDMNLSKTEVMTHFKKAFSLLPKKCQESDSAEFFTEYTNDAVPQTILCAYCPETELTYKWTGKSREWKVK